MGTLCSYDSGVEFQLQSAPNHLGRMTWTGVWGYRSAALTALRRAEEIKGSPPYILEIAHQWNSIVPMLAPIVVLVALQDLYKTDIMLADKDNHRFSLNPAY